MREKQTGLLLFVGGLAILMTIFFEYQIGWIGSARPTSELPQFIFTVWPSLKTIWSFQMLGFGLLAAASLLRVGECPPYQAALWSALTILTVLVIAAFGITVGGYQPALEVYATQPEIFDTLRGAVRGLYSPGLLGGMLVFTVLFLIESAANNGAIGRIRGAITIGFIIAAIIVGAITPLTVKVTGASWFLLPVVMGYCFLRAR